MDNQRFHKCANCGLGQLLPPDTHCMECASDALVALVKRMPNWNALSRPTKFRFLEAAELDLENGVINEGQYLEMCNKLREK